MAAERTNLRATPLITSSLRTVQARLTVDLDRRVTHAEVLEALLGPAAVPGPTAAYESLRAMIARSSEHCPSCGKKIRRSGSPAAGRYCACLDEPAPGPA